MRISLVVLLMVLVLTSAASAATINLSDGRAVQGDIIKEDAKSIQISVDGVSMTYYADEIKDVDGHSLGATPAVVPPVVQPEIPTNPVPTPIVGVDTVDPTKKALILKFIDVFGTRQALTTNFDLMLKKIEKEKPEEAQNIRQHVKIDEIIERLVPIYDRHFTSEELQAFVAFYGSPEGQKLIDTIPELMKESVTESVKYMQEKFPEVK